MKARYDQQILAIQREEKHVGETPQERTTRTPQDHRELQWVRGHAVHGAIDLSLETPTQSREFRFVPIVGLDQFKSRGRGKENFLHLGTTLF
jgi:hypothetical protein